MIKHYNTLTEALQAHADCQTPDQSATKILHTLREKHPTAKYGVLFVNQEFSSSRFGSWTVVPVGPDNTYQTVEELDGKHLFDLPSQRQYPVAYIDLEAPNGL